MIEHPVPQNFTSYQFHLIGNMTIKQFLVLLAGAGVGFMFYSTNLPGLFKWPIVIIAVLTGIAIAFVPYEERTLDQWLINFIKAMYRPTKFYWRRTARVPDFFTYSASEATTRAQAQPNYAPQRRQQVSQFLSTLQTTQAQQVTDPLDMFDAKASEQSLNALFDTVAPAANVVPGETLDVPKPNLQARARPLGETVFSQTAPAKPTGFIKPITPAPVFLSPETVANTPQETAPADESTPPDSSSSPKGGAETVKVETVSIDAQVPVMPANQSASDSPGQSQTPPATAYVDTKSAAKLVSTQQLQPAIFDRSLPFPSTPTAPNMVIGMVHDANHNILPNAIVEILDEAGSTVRAMKTNSLGQFYISTALPDGTFTIETDHDGHKFPTYTFTLNGSIVDPIDIQATD